MSLDAVNFHVFSKKEGGTVCIKMVVDRIEIDPRSMCQLLFEAENYKEWFPFTRESRVVSKHETLTTLAKGNYTNKQNRIC